MAKKFTVRVELHDATAKDYEDLHETMEDYGFDRTIEGSQNNIYALPTAEYRYRGTDNDTAASVRDKAKFHAETIKENPAILVTESISTAWTGLKKATG